MNDFEKLQQLTIFTQALSNSIKTTNRYWLALVLVSVITLTTSVNYSNLDSNINIINKNTDSIHTIFLGNEIDTKNKYVINYIGEIKKHSNNNEVKVPFIGNLSQDQFYPISALLISILIILFGISQSHTVRSRKLLELIEDNMCLDLFDNKDSHRIDVRDITTLLTTTSINKTAPLAQVLLGKYPFHHHAYKQSKLIRALLRFYDKYILKVLSFTVMYVLPTFALIVAFKEGELYSLSAEINHLHISIVWIVSLIASLVMLQLMVSELWYSFIRRFTRT